MHDAFQFDRWVGKRVLDLGCGAGVDAAEFKRYGAEVVALDWTRVATKMAIQHCDAVQAAATDLPFKRESFDLVYAFGVLHHIPEKYTCMADIARVLKPDGSFMGMVYNRDSLLYGYSIQYLRMETEERLGCPYAATFTKTEITDLLRCYFKDVSVGVRYNVVDVPGKRKVKLSIPDEVGLGWHLVIKSAMPLRYS
jgi:ubiquinone/menaquinone biosynthesis C-methylase UbiE